MLEQYCVQSTLNVRAVLCTEHIKC